MEDIFSNLSTYGYIALFIYSLTGGFLGLMTASVFSFMGNMEIEFVIITAITANFIGDILIFYFSRTNKKELLSYLKNHRKEVAFSKLLLYKYGDKVIFIQKYIQGVRTLIPVIFGFSSYSIKRFIYLNFIASFVWGTSIGFITYYSGSYLVPFVEAIIEQPYYLSLIGLFFILSFIFYYKIVRRTRVKKRI